MARKGGYGKVDCKIVRDSTLTPESRLIYTILATYSDKNRESTAAIVSELDRGVTILHGQGAYTGKEKDVLMCAFKQREITAIKAAVKEADPNAFLIVCDAHDVLGEGFKEYKKDDI